MPSRRFISPSAEDANTAILADGIIALHQAQVGGTVGELAQAIDELAGNSADNVKVARGLAKITAGLSHHRAARRSQRGRVAPDGLHVGRAGATARARRRSALPAYRGREDCRRSPPTQGMAVPALRASLYADLKDRQLIQALAAPTAEELLQRYNTALAQAMLYRATRLVLDVGDSFRMVFKYMKLAGLMHSITPLPGGLPHRYRRPGLALQPLRALRHRHGQPAARGAQMPAMAAGGEGARRQRRKNLPPFAARRPHLALSRRTAL